MTTLSNNIQRLKGEMGISIKYIADKCGVSPAAASQWMQKKNPYTPSLDSLITLAGLFQTTIEELATNPKCKMGEVVSPLLNFLIVEHIFELVEADSTLSYAYHNASPRKRAYMFGLIYSLLEDSGINGVTTADIFELMQINQDSDSGRTTKNKTANRTVKRNRQRKTKT